MTEWPPKDFAKRARDGTWTHESTIDAAQDEIEFLHARIARLQSALATARREALEALKPFATCAETLEPLWRLDPAAFADDEQIARRVQDEIPWPDGVSAAIHFITYGDLRRALKVYRALLSQSVEVGPTSTGTDSSEHFRALAQAFDATDDKDWDHLFLMIPASGHGQFWMRVFNVVRKNLARIRQQESHCLQQHDHRAPAVGDKAGNHPLTASKASGPQPPPTDQRRRRWNMNELGSPASPGYSPERDERKLIARLWALHDGLRKFEAPYKARGDHNGLWFGACALIVEEAIAELIKHWPPPASGEEA